MSAKKSVFHFFSTLLVFVFILSFGGPAASTKPAKAAMAASLLQFTSGGHALGFTSQAVYAATGNHALHVNFLGAHNIQPQADSPASPSAKPGFVPPLSRVSYPGLWDGIDLVYTAAAGGIYTTTYTLAPSADSSNIRLHYNAPLALNKDGTLRIAFETGALTESAPIAWQDISGKRIAVDVAFQVRGQEVGFKLGAYNPHHALTIDPSLIWNAFLGSSATDAGNAITVDGSGNIYVAGTSSATWGTPVRVYTSNSDAFVARLNAATGSLIWNAFLGGTGADVGNAIALDGSGNVYVTGSSAATWGTPQRAYTATGNDIFAAKLNSAGGLAWNTFLGGTGTDTGSAIAVDGTGNVFVSGFSSATWDTPVRAYTATGNDAVIAKLDTSGGLLWNTFLGASGTDSGNAIAVDGSGNVFVAGRSAAAWSCPVACTVRAYTSSFDAFVAQLNATTGALIWNTFLGASGSDEGNSIALDGSGNIYLAGYSSTTWGSPVLPYTASTFDAFAAKLDTSGNLIWNTFMGGSGQDLGKSIAVAASGHLLVSGNSTATWGSPLRAYSASEDGFAAKLNASTGSLTANTFLGSTGIDGGYSIAVDGSGNTFVAGSSSTTWGSPVLAYTASNDAFVAKIDLAPPTVVSSTLVNLSPTNRATVQFIVTFSESVTGVDTADFSLTSVGVTGATVSGVSGAGTTRTVSVNTGSGNGTIRLNVIDNDTIIDASSNPLGGAGAGNANFTTGQVYTVNKVLTFTSIAADDGWILESSETSGLGGSVNSTSAAMNLGDNAARQQYLGILSFNTTNIPDTAVITAVNLKVTKSSTLGNGDPLITFQGFKIDIKTGFFGTSPALQATDFQATANKVIGPITPTLVSNAYNINLLNGKDAINKLTTNNGLTQIRLRFKLDDNNNATANILILCSGNHATVANRPQLVVTYYVP